MVGEWGLPGGYNNKKKKSTYWSISPVRFPFVMLRGTHLQPRRTCSQRLIHFPVYTQQKKKCICVATTKKKKIKGDIENEADRRVRRQRLQPKEGVRPPQHPPSSSPREKKKRTCCRFARPVSQAAPVDAGTKSMS